MNNQANPNLIGLFVLGATLLLIIGILIFGSGKWFHETKRYVVYFDESINGLVVGAPVKLNGVQIGQVVDIKVERDSVLKQMLAPVIFEIEPDKIINFDHMVADQEPAVVLQNLIQEGLRMQLQMSSLLTGRLFIEARFQPETPVKLIRTSRNGLKEIPSMPSSVQVIQNTAKQLLADLEKMPLNELIEEIRLTFRSVNEILNSEQTGQTLMALNHSTNELEVLLKTLNKQAAPISENLLATLVSMNHIAKNFDKESEPLLIQTNLTMQAVGKSIVKFEETLAGIDEASKSLQPAVQKADTALKDISKAAKSFKLLMDYLERHPEALIQGKKH